MTPPPAAAAAPSVQPRRPTAPYAPRRVSGPSRRRSDRPAELGRDGHDVGLIFGLIASLEGLAQHRMLDRLIRGRIWIGILAFALIGIVTLQLGLLKLNGGIGRALEHEAMLQRENAALSIEDSELEAGERIESHAARLGMVNVPAGALSFLSAHPRSDAAKAAAALNGATRSARSAAATSSAASASGESSESQSGESGESQSSAAPSGSGESQSSAESPATASTEAAGAPSSETSESTSGGGSTAAASEPSSSGSGAGTPAGGTQGE